MFTVKANEEKTVINGTGNVVDLFALLAAVCNGFLEASKQFGVPKDLLEDMARHAVETAIECDITERAVGFAVPRPDLEDDEVQ